MSYRKLLTLSAVAIFATAGMAQTTEALQKELNAYKAEMNAKFAALQSENAALRATPAQDDAVEAQVNRLTERLAAGCTLNSRANQITMDGEFRIRSDWAFGSPGALGDDNHDGHWAEERVRLGFKYDFARDVSAKASLQKNFVHGDNQFTSSEFGDVQLYEGWIEMRNLFNRSEFSSRSGRQELVFGNQFQFGNADWFNGTTFDGSRWDWTSECFDLTGLMFHLSSTADTTLNQAYTFGTNHHDDELYGLYFTLKTIKNHKLDLYWIYTNGDGGVAHDGGVNASSGGGPLGGVFGNTLHFHTFGGRIGGTFDVACGLDWNVEAAYQTGGAFGFATTTGYGGEIDEFTAEAEVGLTFNKDSKFRVFVRGLYAEGAHDGETGYINLWTNRHSNTASFRARYGIFDLFPMTNVWSLQGGLHFDPATNWTLGLTGVWATTDERINPVGDRDYGFEVDLWGEYRYSDTLTLGGGLALMFPDDQGSFVWGTDTDTQFLGYLQARIAF